MFKLGFADRFTYPVSFEVVSDGGKRNKFSFDAVLKRPSREEYQAYIKAAVDGEKSDLDIAREVLLGWKGVQDENGDDLPFSETARDNVLNITPVLPAVIDAFMESNSGKGRTKN